MAFLDGTTPLAFAHRGFAPDGAENSMAAFQRAIDLGYRYLETDVRVTADGVALAFHDAGLDRVTNQRGQIADLPWSDVRRARIAGLEPIPLLTDVLGTWPDAYVNIDVKADVGVGPTADAIRRTGAVDRVCLGSFASRRIDVVREVLGPRLCTSLGPRDALALRVTPHRVASGRIHAVSAQCAQVPSRIGRFRFVDARFIERAHGLGLQVHAWTVNERTEMVRLLELGVDGIMTDRADLLRELLISRGQWPV